MRSSNRFTHGASRPTPPHSRLSRWHNPLFRRSDRYQALASGLLVAFWLVLIPFVATGASTAAAGARQSAAADARELIQAKATLLQDAVARYDFRGVAVSSTVPVRASWLSPRGSVIEGDVPAGAGLSAGAVVTVWVTPAGAAHAAPLTSEQAAVQSTADIVGGWMLLGAMLFGADRVIRLLCRRHNLRRWASEWAAMSRQSG